MMKNVSNNAVLTNANASPMKDGIADNNTRFSMGRMLFTKTMNERYQPNDYLQKKLYGSKDASSRTHRLHYQAVGKGSFNEANSPNSFVNTKDINVTKDALRRVRAGGYVVPPKVTNK